MTSHVIPPLPSVGLPFASRAGGAVSSASSATAGSGAQATTGAWRRKGSVQSHMGLSWMVAIGATFLAVGLIGMAPYVPVYHLKSLEDLVNLDDAPMIETSMAELMSQQEAETEVAEEPTELPVEISEVLETPQPMEDLPELVEAMTLEDIFAVPSAPKIEDALRPVDPVVKPKPRPTPTPNKPRSTVAKSSGTGSPNARPGAVGGTAGGTGMGKGSGKGKFPAPPYPSFARSSGMQGTVRLSISVGASGAVEGVSVTSSTGYSALDSYAVSWVRRNWRWPGGASNRYTLPLTFRLR